MNTILATLVGLLPASTIAAVIANLITKALANIKDKEKAGKIAEASACVADAAKITAEAVKDCEVTEDEVNQVTDAVTKAVIAIKEAAK